MPYCAQLAGPSQSGKSNLMLKILQSRNQLFDKHIDRIVYCSSTPLANPEMYEGAEFVLGMPNLHEFDPSLNNLLILDDLMSECEKDKEIQNLFTVYSHHKNISVFIITQNLFSKGACARTISLNSQYLIVFNNPRDAGQIRRLGIQMFPEKSNFLAQAYQDAVESKKYGYLFIDNTQATPSKYRISTNILPEETRIFYRIK
jgi:hypothetical protein